MKRFMREFILIAIIFGAVGISWGTDASPQKKTNCVTLNEWGEKQYKCVKITHPFYHLRILQWRMPNRIIGS